MTQTGTLAGAGGGGHQADEGGDPVATIGRPEHPAGPSPPGPATTALSAALLALAAVSVTGAWRSATGRHDPGELAVVLAVAITGLAVVWFLDDALFRPHPRRRQVVRLGLGATAAGLGAVAWLGAAGTIDVATARSLAVGLCLARPLLGAVQASQRPRSVWWQLLGAIAVWNAGLVLYATLGPGLGPWDRLVWDTADQVPIYRYATLLVDGDFRPFAYLLGVPALVAPVTLVTGQATSDLAVGANLANTFFAPVQAVVVMPAFLWGAARVACRATGVRPAAARVGAGMVVAAGLVFAYALVVPPYVPDRHAGLVPRRLLGLVYGAEPLGYVALAGAMLVLARRDRPWNPVAVGLLTGLALTLHERFAPSAALFLVLLVVQRAHWRRAPAAAAAALAAFLPQLLYFRLVYGGWLFPNRDAQWDNGGDGEQWLVTARERFGLPRAEHPSRISVDYLGVNGADMLATYWPALVALVLAVVVLLWRRPRQWPLWLFCVGHIVLTALISGMYINVVVTWRYIGVVLPAVAVLLVAALWAATSRDGRDLSRSRTDRRARRSRRTSRAASPA